VNKTIVNTLYPLMFT